MGKKKIAIITGASGGLGQEFIKLLLRENVSEIWAIARNKDKLDALAAKYGDRIVPMAFDLTDPSSREQIQDILKERRPSIKYLINNAGFAKFCSYDDISIEESMNMIDLNIKAVVALGLICIPYMRPGSHLINIASEAAFFPLPYQNIYSSTKAFVRNYTRALNVELREKRICATAVCPGWMDTGLLTRGTVGAEKATKKFVGMVETAPVARKAMLDAKKGKDMSVYGWFDNTMHILSKIIPQKIVMKVWLRQQNIR